MDDLKPQREWLTIPTLPCVEIEETLAFWKLLGFKITYKQTRPYQYGILERGGFELHFGRVKGMHAGCSLYNGCLIMVSDAGKVYAEFAKILKTSLGKIPHSGIPRISRMRPGTTRFTLTDVSGNSIIFISYGEEDQKTWEKPADKSQTPLQKSIATSLRFRDFKEDEKAAAAILDVALRKVEDESAQDYAEALIIRIDLAGNMNDLSREEECRLRLSQLNLATNEKEQLARKHGVNV